MIAASAVKFIDSSLVLSEFEAAVSEVRKDLESHAEIALFKQLQSLLKHEGLLSQPRKGFADYLLVGAVVEVSLVVPEGEQCGSHQ